MTSGAAVWIDTDMGVDDIHAVIALMAHRPVAGLSLAFGCAALPCAVRNAVGAAEAFGWTCPVFAGAGRPVLGRAETAERILGPRGLPTRGRMLPEVGGALPPALPALAAWAGTGGPLLALGPLTNLAAMALAHPDAALPPIVWMGGALGRGNHTEHAEFNAFADPLALAILLDRGADLTMVDLDACRRVRLVEQDLSAIADPLLADLLGGYLDIGLSRGRDHMALYDPVAAAALAAPGLFAFRTIRMRVDTSDAPTRGATRIAGDGWPVRVVADLDAEAVRDWCLAPLGRVPA